jgi:hypothetical protein
MRKPFPVLLALLLIALSVAAAAFGMADIYRREAAMLIEANLAAVGEEPTDWRWAQAQRYLWVAVRLAPLDTHVLSDLGQLYELRGNEAPAPEANADFERALAYYRQALALCPASPDAWADVALLKVNQHDIDAEFALALQQALDLGPWQTRVQASIAGGGLAVWDKLPATLQTRIEDTVARGLANGSRLMRVVARRFELFHASEAGTARIPDPKRTPER